jgi:capsule polysaccharide export protein KpsE/RkpR
MSNYRGFDLLDIFIVFVKRKVFFSIFFVIVFILSYLSVYFLIPAEYDSSALIVSAEESNMNLLGSLAGGLKDIPFDIMGFSGGANDSYNLFTTIILSRTNIEDLVNNFNLDEDYKVDEREKLIKLVRDKITIEVTDEMGYLITVRAISPQKSADMTNYLLKKINGAVIELNVKKAKENRIFLADRYEEILTNLANSEDSLKDFQLRTGMYQAEKQTESLLETYASLESDLAVKQIELAILEKLTGSNSAQTENARITAREFENKLDNLKFGKNNQGFLIPLKKLPNDIINFYRYFRNVEIYNAMLEFIIPLYEQSRFEEIKAIPVLQVIDKAIPPEKKSYPPRLIFSFLITFFVLGIILFIMFLNEIVRNSENEKVKFIREEIFKFRSLNKTL